MALVDLVHVQAEDVEYGGTNVAAVLPNTPESAGNLQLAAAAGGRIQISNPIDTVTETTLAPGTVVDNNSLVTSVNKYFTYTPQSNTVIRGGRYKHNQAASVIRTALGGARKVKIEDIDITGSITPTGDASYAIDIRDSNDVSIDGASVTAYTGALFINGSINVDVRNLHATSMVYHPALVAGGYGVLMANARNVVVDGLYFSANKAAGDLGRHAFYISNNGDASTRCTSITLKNIYADYTNIDDRNMWAGNIRTCDNVCIDNFNVNSANAGLALNPEQGPITNVRVSNSRFLILQYEEGTGVYALAGAGRSTIANPETDITGFHMENCSIEVRRKPGFTGTPACVAISFGGSSSTFNNITISTNDVAPGNSSPVMLYKSKDLSFSNIRLVSAGSNPMFYLAETVTGAKFSCIRTPGTVLLPSNLVERGVDISVDWTRAGNVGVNSGTVTLADAQRLFKSVTVDATSTYINFNDHVTWDAISSCTVNAGAGTSATIVGRNASTKQLVVRCWNGSTVIAPTTGTVSFDVTLTK